MDRNYVCFFSILWGMTQFKDSFWKSDAMVSILRRHKVLPCVLKFHRDHELYFGLKDLIILTISSTQNSKDESLSLIPKFIFTGTVLSLDIGVHCLAKKLLNRSALSKKKLYLPVVVISVKSYYHLQMFSRWPNMFLGLFSGHLVYFVIFQYGRTYSIWYI